MADTPWKIVFTSDTQEEFDHHFKIHPDQTPYKDKFKQEVTTNPYYNPARKRIAKMHGRHYKGTYRWSESNTRVIYIPESQSRTVYPIETGTAIDISYKKRSRRK